MEFARWTRSEPWEEVMYDPGNVQKIVEPLKETEAESKSERHAQRSRCRPPASVRRHPHCRPRRLWRVRTARPGAGRSRAGDRARQYRSLMGPDGVCRPHFHRRSHGAPRAGRDLRRPPRHAYPRGAIASRHLPAHQRRLHPQRAMALCERRRPWRLGLGRLQGHPQRGGRALPVPDRGDAQEGRRHRRHLVHARHARHRFQGCRSREHLHS